QRDAASAGRFGGAQVPPPQGRRVLAGACLGDLPGARERPLLRRWGTVRQGPRDVLFATGRRRPFRAAARAAFSRDGGPVFHDAGAGDISNELRTGQGGGGGARNGAGKEDFSDP